MTRHQFILATLLALAAPASAGRMAGDPALSSDVRDFLKPSRSAATGGGTIGDAVHGVAVAMADIGQDLGRQDTSLPVQTKQRNVADSLDVMIKSLEQACNGGGGGNMNPTQGLKKSILAGGPGGVGELHDTRAGEKQWGALKPKDRDQILQAKTDGFPAGYESLLQSYYRRLSTEDNAAAGSTSAAPPAAPGAAHP